MQKIRIKTQWIIFISFFTVPILDIFRLDLINQSFHLFTRAFSFQKGFLYLLALLFLVISFVAISKWSERRFCSWFCPHNTVIRLLFKIECNQLLLKAPASIKTFIIFTLSLVVAMIASFGILAYFIHPIYLAITIIQLQFLTVSGTFFIFLSIILFLLIFFLRQRFCKFACPYGHFQKIFSDHKSRNSFKDINKLLFILLLLLLFSMVTFTFLSTQFEATIHKNVTGIKVESNKVFSYELEIRNYDNKPHHYIINVDVPDHWELVFEDCLYIDKKASEKTPLIFFVPKGDFDEYFLLHIEIMESDSNKSERRTIAINT